jgi:hypothetical protein
MLRDVRVLQVDVCTDRDAQMRKQLREAGFREILLDCCGERMVASYSTASKRRIRPPSVQCICFLRE